MMTMTMTMMSNQAITGEKISKLGSFKLKELFTGNQSSELTLHEPDESDVDDGDHDCQDVTNIIINIIIATVLTLTTTTTIIIIIIVMAYQQITTSHIPTIVIIFIIVILIIIIQYHLRTALDSSESL